MGSVYVDPMNDWASSADTHAGWPSVQRGAGVLFSASNASPTLMVPPPTPILHATCPAGMDCEVSCGVGVMSELGHHPGIPIIRDDGLIWPHLHPGVAPLVIGSAFSEDDEATSSQSNQNQRNERQRQRSGQQINADGVYENARGHIMHNHGPRAPSVPQQQPLGGANAPAEAKGRRARFLCHFSRIAQNFVATCAGHPNSPTTRGPIVIACRFCHDQVEVPRWKFSSKNLAKISVCKSMECASHQRHSCRTILPCGHTCAGIKGEKMCAPCLVDGCRQGDGRHNMESDCSICLEALHTAPCIKLGCSHMFHTHCIASQLEKKWGGPDDFISFRFMHCAMCNSVLQHQSISRRIQEVLDFKQRLVVMGIEFIKSQPVSEFPEFYDPNSNYHTNPQTFVERKLAFYTCLRCLRPYCGGLQRCHGQADGRRNAPRLCTHCYLKALKCSPCKTHGTEYLEYKCYYCCRVASFFCWGRAHLCAECHSALDRGAQPIGPNCHGNAALCPLGIKHAPRQREVVLGCVACRSSTQSERASSSSSADAPSVPSPIPAFQQPQLLSE